MIATVNEWDVGEWRKEDDPYDMVAIAADNGFSPEWTVQPGWTVLCARYYGHIVAFACYHFIPEAIHVDDLWCRHSRAGVAGIGQLAQALETLAQTTATARGPGYTLRLGGVVYDDNPRHGAALLKRGYRKVAIVVSKDFYG